MSITRAFGEQPAVPPLALGDGLPPADALALALALADGLPEAPALGQAVGDAAPPDVALGLPVVAAVGLAAADADAPGLGHGVGSGVGAKVHCAGPETHADTRTRRKPATASTRHDAEGRSMSVPVCVVRDEGSRERRGHVDTGRLPAPGDG
jgi:hypothetical protein